MQFLVGGSTATSSSAFDEEIAERRKQGRGLESPERAVILAYSKIWLTTNSRRPRRPMIRGWRRR
jgi:NAD-specific glutamate dehydrogenase